MRRNKNISQNNSTGEPKSLRCCSVRIYPRVGLPQPRRIQPTQKIPKAKKIRRNLAISADFWWRLLDSNQWPHACEACALTS